MGAGGHAWTVTRANAVARPPYRRRWVTLLGTVATVVCLTVWLLRPGAAGEQAPQVPAVEAPAPPPLATDLVTRAAGDGNVVALTFDDGPHPDHTPRILDLLARHRATATFCMVGRQAAQHPELVAAVAAAGMRLCAHSIGHDGDLPSRPLRVIEAEVSGSKAILTAAAPDAAVEYFRAPQGNWSEQITLTATANGMRPLSWSIDSRDWERPGVDQIVATVQGGLAPGAIILLHDGGGRRDQTVAALERLLPWLVERGYRFAAPG